MTDRIKIKVKRRDAILKTLRTRRDALGPNSPTVKATLIRVASIVIAQAKLNVRKGGTGPHGGGKPLIDTGRLINSLRFEFFREKNVQGVRVGSFGVPYAAVHEFGFTGIQRVRGHTRLITTAFGQVLPQPVLASIGPFTRFQDIPPRPYLGPAFETHRARMLDMLSKALGGG